MTTPWDRRPWFDSDRFLARLLVRPAVEFMRIEAAGGLVLLAGAVAALIWVNVAPDSYHDFWNSELSIDLSIVHIVEPLEAWVNDLLMTFFFLVVAMEIKRELVHGELSSRRQATLPVMGALGGMIVPAAFFLALNAGSNAADGWAIPVATDIAFALGVLSLLGRRVPFQLKIFLLALAVADDVGGIVLIAVLFTEDLDVTALGIAIALVALIWLMQRAHVRAIPAYAVVAAALWLATFESGIEATLSGVVLGLMTPASPLYARERFQESAHRLEEDYRDGLAVPDPSERRERVDHALRGIEDLARESSSPLERLERLIVPWSSFVIVPIFALANAGIDLRGSALPDAAGSSLAWGVASGLVLGKILGITGFSFLALRLGLAAKPPGMRWDQLIGVALLGGIGFTVAIFIANLSFDDPQLVSNAKIGITAASIVAAVGGYTLLRLLPPWVPPAPDGVPRGPSSD